jgi:hypothetical protein
MSDECTQERFLQDVKDHTLQIINDNGVNRHLRLSNGNSSIYYFDIITYDNHLVISGDMGAYVFSRITDMFRFFRNDEGREDLYINLGYWAEKIQSGRSEVTEFSYKEFELRVLEYLEQYESREDYAELLEEVKDEILCGEEDESYCRRAVSEFRWNSQYFFHDTWEWDLTVYKYRYVWCCYAIAWAIKQYDNAKKQ